MIGKTISRYRILEQVGAGGMGIVYRARDEQLERDVAIKVLPPGMLADPAARRRFRKEALSLARVNFPSIATIHEFGSEGDLDFLVTEYISGTTLDAKLRAGRLALAEVLHLGAQLAQGLAAAHQHGIVHRDLKPGNLRVTPDGRLKILDFGLAQFAPQASDLGVTVTVTKTTDLTGTLPYMAPEQLKGEAADPRSDLWAAGTVLYEMSTGKRPFVQTNGPLLIHAILSESPVPPSAVDPSLPANLENVILKALEKDPARRYQSATEMYVDLDRIAHPSSHVTGPVSQPLASSAFSKAIPWNIVLPILLVCALLAGLYFVWSTSHRHAGTAVSTSAVEARKSVAVLGFKNLSGKPEQKWISEALSEMLTVELSAGDKLKTIPGENVARTKADLNLSDSDSFSPDTLESIRRRLGNSLVVLGSYLDLGGDVRVDIRVQDTAKGDTVATLSSSRPEAKLLDLVKDLGSQLRDKCGAGAISGEEAAQVRAAQPATADAARLYAEGVAKLRSFDNLGAREALQQAVAAEPNNALAHLALARALGELGYDAKAVAEAEAAFELARSLSRRESLLIEANYREASRDWPRAMELYKSLWTFYPDELEYGLRLADVQVAAGQPQDTLATVNSLRQLPDPLREDPRIDLAESRARATLGEYQKAVAGTDDAAAKAVKIGAHFVQAEALLEQCEDLRALGQYAQAKARGEQANQTFQQAGDTRRQAKSLTCVGNVASDQGNLVDARAMYEKALALARQTGAQNDIAGSLINLGNLLAANDQLDESSRHYREAITVAQTAGDSADALLAEGNLGANLVSQGALDEARKHFESAARSAQTLGNAIRSLEADINLAMVAYLQGDLENADAHLQQSLRRSKELRMRSNEAICLSALGDLLLTKDDLSGAGKRYQEALNIRTQLGEKGGIAATRASHALLELEQNHPGEAESLARAAADEFHAENMPSQEMAARDVLAQALLASSKLDEASSVLEQASSLKGADIPTQLSFEITRGRVLARRGSAGEGEQKIRAAEQRAHQLRVVPASLQARLALAEFQVANKESGAKATLESLEGDAAHAHFQLIARKARALRAAAHL
jgi:serine/threonine protein kinase/tetratricopeptide (TPR) repeat protein